MLRQFGQELVDNPIPKSIEEHILFHISLGIISGITFTFAEKFYNKYFKRNTTFGLSIIVSSVMYLFIFVLLITIGVIFYTIGDGQFKWSIVPEYLLSKEGGLFLFYFYTILLLSDFVKQVDRKFGPGNLFRMLRGEFYEPKEVERIVMFLDLKSSTTIAEKLGHYKFSRLLQDCFNELNIVTKYKAEIYQYVGDEVVLVWEKEKGMENVIDFYFEYSRILESKSDYFLNEFNVVPEFKCGCHIGQVIMTEIGQIKREIVYHGDVMNTASRIQDQCSVKQKKMLISEDLFNVLSFDERYLITPIEDIILKGKKSLVKIYSVSN